MIGIERRRHPRYSCQANLEISWGSEILIATIRDISSSGMFVETAMPLWVRAEFSARIALPKPVKVNCIVRRVEPGRGMGVEFKDMSDSSRETLDDLFEKLAVG